MTRIKINSDCNSSKQSGIATCRFLFVFVAIFLIVIVMPTVVCGQNNQSASTATINMTDATGQKQGFWRIKQKNNSIEEGLYVNGKKDGEWRAFFPNGTTKYCITFVNGLPKGSAVFYYEDGQVMEQGVWDVNHWTGNYTFYHPNGKPAYQFNFNDAGKREGDQLYYYDNGNLKYSGRWDDGKPHGSVDVYNEKGIHISERIYEEGEFSKTVKTKEIQQDEFSNFTGTGHFTLYNLDGSIAKKGNFKSGKLIDGENYIYNAQNELIRVDRYKDGIKTE